MCDDDCYCCCSWDCACAQTGDDTPHCTPECVCRCNGYPKETPTTPDTGLDGWVQLGATEDGSSRSESGPEMLPETFARYRDPDLPDAITDPAARVAALLRYVKARYHVVPSLTPHVEKAAGGVLPGYTPSAEVRPPGLETGYRLSPKDVARLFDVPEYMVEDKRQDES